MERLGDIVIKPSYVPFVGVGLKFFFLVVPFLYLARWFLAPSLPPELALLLTGLTLLMMVATFAGLVAVLVGIVRRNAFTYLITDGGIIITRQLVTRDSRQIPYDAISDVQVLQGFLGRLFNYGDVIPITRSGFGLMTDPRGRGVTSYTSVAEMTDTPNPFSLAHQIRERMARRYRASAY
jgi:uncharacterized membrane protein YdbT with pleckstrin-like domain